MWLRQTLADLLTLPVGAHGALHTGVMAGYATSTGQSVSRVTGYRADRTLRGYSGGLSVTWYQDELTRTGLYSDHWIQYS